METTPKRTPDHTQETSLHAFRKTVHAFIDAEVPSSLKGRPQGIVQGPGPTASELQTFYHHGLDWLLVGEPSFLSRARLASPR